MIEAKLIIIDDNEAVLKTLRLVLGGVFSKVVAVANPTLIPALIAGNDVDVVLLDMNFGSGKLDGQDGLFWLNRIKNESNLAVPPSVVLITAFGDIELAVASLKKGADDFVQKPWDNERLVHILTEAVQKHRQQLQGVQEETAEEETEGASALIVRSLLKKYARAYAKPIPELTEEAGRLLVDLCKQGELNRLQETIERTMLLSFAPTWEVADVVLSEARIAKGALTLEEMEKQFISGVLQETGHNLLLAAGQLGISRQTLYNKMKKYEIC